MRIVFMIEWTTKNGTKYKSSNTWETQSDAERFAADYIAEHNTGHNPNVSADVYAVQRVETWGDTPVVCVEDPTKAKAAALAAAESAFYAQFEKTEAAFKAAIVEQEDDGDIEPAGVLTTFGAHHDQDTAFIASTCGLEPADDLQDWANECREAVTL